MNAVENQTCGKSPSRNYWRLWLVDAGLVSAGLLFFLACQYGTYEFFGVACLMALLPLIPVIVLVAGGGSTLFALTKAMIEKRSLRTPAALVLLLGPGLIVTLLLVFFGAAKSPAHRLSYICHGNAPATASHVRVVGYSSFLHEEWLAIFNVGQQDFQTMMTKSELVPIDDFEFKRMLEGSSLKRSSLFQDIPNLTGLPCFKRTFKPDQEHERGCIYAMFDTTNNKAVVVREYQD